MLSGRSFFVQEGTNEPFPCPSLDLHYIFCQKIFPDFPLLSIFTLFPLLYIYQTILNLLSEDVFS